jgi:hypothetical protein
MNGEGVAKVDIVTRCGSTPSHGCIEGMKHQRGMREVGIQKF